MATGVDMMPRQSGRSISMSISPLPEHQRVRKFRHKDEKYELGEDDSGVDHDDDDDDSPPAPTPKE